MPEFLMPSLGADMDEGTVVEWFVKPGDVVHRGDIVAGVETQKGIIEVEIWDDGVIEALLVEPGHTVAVGTPIARLGPIRGATALDEKPPEAATPTGPPSGTARTTPAVERPAPSPPVRHLAHALGVELEGLTGSGPGGAVTRDDVHAAAAPQPGARVAPPPPGGRVAASPLARRRAEELRLDLTAIHGSGPGGVVVESDVLAFSGGGRAGPAMTRHVTDPNAAIRAAIARLMAKAKREIPHYYLAHQIDMSRALRWLEGENLARPVTERMLPAVLLLKAAALGTRAVPQMNGFWVDDRFQPGAGVHLGVAISLRGGGLVAPAIHDADTRTLAELMAALRDLVKRTRSGGLRSSEMSDPTITVTNLGDQGVEAVYGVIYPPQVALVGFGKIVERPWAAHGMVGARPVVTVTLSADHRAGDGHTGGLYLAEIERLLQQPEEL